MVQQQLGFYQQVKKEYLDSARWTARKLLNKQSYVTTDDIWAVCPPPKVLNPKIMGSIFQDRDFESIGFTYTRRPSSHGRPIRKFRMKAA